MRPSFALRRSGVVDTTTSLVKEGRIGISGYVWRRTGIGEELYPNSLIGALTFAPSPCALLTRQRRYRVNPKLFRAARWGDSFNTGLSSLKERIQFKHRALARDGGIPIKAAHKSIALEPVGWDPPFPNKIDHASKSIMFVLPWLYIGGADIGALHMVQLFAEAGYRVTVVCTLYKNPQGIELRPLVMQWTHDIHILPSFLRAHDFPRYIKYLIESRGIEDVVLSNSQLMYELLPALTEQLPHVKFIDVRPLFVTCELG